MTILARFKLNHATISVVETPEGINIEVHGAKDDSHELGIRNYLVEEGILDEILSGNPNFGQKAFDV
jgi:hypothetical protein